MPVYQKLGSFLFAFFFLLILQICIPELGFAEQKLGVAEELVAPIFSQEYSFQEQPHILWKTVSHIINSRITQTKGRALVRDANNYVFAWVELLGKKTNERDKTNSADKPDENRPYHENEIVEVGEGGIAITTVSVRNRINGSLLRIRRVYYGLLTQPRMVHSRGVFGYHFHKLVKQEIGSYAEKNTF